MEKSEAKIIKNDYIEQINNAETPGELKKVQSQFKKESRKIKLPRFACILVNKAITIKQEAELAKLGVPLNEYYLNDWWF